MLPSKHDLLQDRRRIRLSNALYQIEGQPVLVTICCRDGRRKNMLTHGAIPRIVEAAIRTATKAEPEVLVERIQSLLEAQDLLGAQREAARAAEVFAKASQQSDGVRQ